MPGDGGEGALAPLCPAASGSFDIPLPLTAPCPPLYSSPPAHRENLDGTAVSVRNKKKNVYTLADRATYVSKTPGIDKAIPTKLSHI